MPEPAAMIPVAPVQVTPIPVEPAGPDMAAMSGGLVAPEAAAAAASSVSALVRTLATERSTAVHRGGPTLEDLVREEMRPLLKSWLDSHLPPLVERLVRAEIERVVSRMAP
jgi:cell pole-organizing protein PopZ